MLQITLDEARTFFAELENDNSREFWARERARYDAGIRPVFTELCGALTVVTGWRIYRPHNDTRFHADTPPYKTFIGAVAERPDGVGAFLQLSRRGLLVATGVPMPAPDQLRRFRLAVADDVSGPPLVDAIAATTGRRAIIRAGRWDPLKRVPRGFPADHPRADLLRWKGIEVNHRVAQPAWTTVADAASAIDAMLDEPVELHGWLGRHVGASALTAEERFAPKRARHAVT